MAAYDCRKTSGTLLFKDEAGRPLVNATLHVEQTGHDFLFGCGAFDAVPAANDKRDDPFFRDRIDKWLKLFNYGTLPFYWGGYEPEEGKPALESRMNAARYLTERGTRVKGHPLCWHTACANWLLKYDDSTILDKQLARIHRDVSAFAGVIDMWDVINEVVIMPDFDRYDNAITRICRRYGQVELVKQVFAAAKAANPNAVLLINDFNLSEKYATLIERCLDAGVPIGAIGLQTHQHQGYMGEAALLEILKRFERFGIPLHFTENTLVSGHLMPPHIVDLNDYQIPEWPSTPEGEARQARELEEMYRLLFDHPLVEAVTGWDFSDGMWLGAPSGVIARDNRLKPAYLALERLIKREWHTTLDVRTDERGCARVSGFKGAYHVSDGQRSGAFHLGKSDSAAEVILA